MRFRTAAVLISLSALGLTGCSRGTGQDPSVATARTGNAVTSSPSASASRDPDAQLKFSQCMRAHGLSWFPDPDPDGRMTVRTPKGFDPRKMEAAQQACAAYAPGSGPGDRKPTAAEMEQMRKLSQCMRENGIPNFPDPSPEGGISIDAGKTGINPDSPTFKKAQQICDKYRPAPPGGGAGVQHAEAGGGK